MPQVAAQPATTSSYQQYNSQQWTPGNANSGPYQQYLQQAVMQNKSSGATSYTPFGFPSIVRPQQPPMGQDQGNYDNHSRPVAPTQEQRRVSSHKEPLHSASGSSQGQRHTAQTYLFPQTAPAHASGPSSRTTYASAPQYAQQSSSTQNVYPEATVSQIQAATSGTTYSQGPLPHKLTDKANQSQPATTATASRRVDRGPQPNVSSSVSTAH